MPSAHSDGHISLPSPNAGSKFRPRLPRCENFTRPPWSDCGSTAAGSGGGRSRGQITRFSLEPLADVASAALAISWPSRREAIVSDVRSKRIVTGYRKANNGVPPRGDAVAALLYRRPRFHLAAAYPGVTVPHGSAPIAWRVIAWPVRVARPVVGVRPIIIGRSQRTADDSPGRHSTPKKRPTPPRICRARHRQRCRADDC